MPQNKTQATSADVRSFLETVEPVRRREDGWALDALFRDVTGFSPRLWGPSIVGYGRYHYRYESGREGDFLATGFSPRKANLVLYIMPGYSDFQHILDRLGKHRLGKSCLYINKLADVEPEVLKELIHAGLDDLAKRWKVSPE
jgi:hypothetical protein